MRRILLLGTLGATIAGAIAAAAWATTTEKLERLNVAETQLSVDQGVNMHRLSRLLSVLEQLKRDPPPALLVSPDDAKDAVRAAILVKALTPVLQVRVQSEALFERDSLAADATPEPASGVRLGAADRPDAPLTPPNRLVMPASVTVVRAFGDPIAGGGRSNGLTLAAAKGARAVSPAGGLVQYVGPVKGWGVIVILRLAGGYHLVLAGLERTSVQVGQSVAEGQPVGWAPDGRHSTSELYLEVREHGSPVDPMRWMNKKAG